MFSSHQKGTFKLTFDNGVAISVVWKPGTYSDNHDRVFDGMDVITGTDLAECTSTTAEIMVLEDPTGDMAVYLRRYHGDQNPVGYLSVNEVMALLTYAWQLQAPAPERSKK